MATQTPDRTEKIEIPQIEATTDYSQFKLMNGNRDVDENHVKRLKREMEENPHLMPARPIIVNENMFIVEGQHSKQAAQELRLPVYYIVIRGATVADTRNLNVTQKRWSILDFAKSWAESGHDDYRTYMRVHNEFPKISPTILRTILNGGQKHDMDINFRRGDFYIENLERSRKIITFLTAVMQKTHVTVNMSMANAFISLWDSKEFDPTVFLEKIERETARESFHASPNIRGSLRSIEDVYNFNNKRNTTRLY